MSEARMVTEATRAAIAASAEGLPFGDRRDFDDAVRGFVARSARRRITAPDGRVVWDLDAYDFLRGEAPATAHPSLWRQGRLLIEDGLFEVVPGIYQLRGYDLSVMTVVEGDTGVIVIDPLLCRETAAAAFALYAEHRGDRPVRAMIYTHSHVDHFGGVKGILAQEDVDAGRVPVIAPEHFMEHAVSENIYAGAAMSRRAGYMYGAALDKGPSGQIGTGLGQTTSTGEVTLIAPTIEVTRTGQEMVIDGVRMVFQLTPGAEAPAEMNIYFPELRTLCAAENASHNLHNILTIRGAPVRDARAWARYLTEAVDLWGDDLEVVFSSHHWPTWGRERAVEYLSLQRDLYLYLHDQTLRMINQGYVAAEIAEVLELPPALQAAWHARGYYGSVSHNVKAVYQRYLGYYDGNPAPLWPHPPGEAARRYVAAMGGAERALAVARAAYDEGDYRWVVEVLNHVLFADEGNAEARAMQANAFEQLGFGAECGTWRNAFLAAAHELRLGGFGTPAATASPDVLQALSVSQVFDSIAIRIDGPRAWDERITLSWVISDEGTAYVTELRNGALNHRPTETARPGTTTLRLSRPSLIGLAAGLLDPQAALADGTVAVEGDPRELERLIGLLAPVRSDFPIVTP